MIEAAYKILKLNKDATPDEAHAAYTKIVRRYPPEHFPEKFKTVCRAYQQITLDDSCVEEFVEKFSVNNSPIALAGFFWGEDPAEHDFDIRDLQNVLNINKTQSRLDALLDSVKGEFFQDEIDG